MTPKPTRRHLLRTLLTAPFAAAASGGTPRAEPALTELLSRMPWAC